MSFDVRSSVRGALDVPVPPLSLRAVRERAGRIGTRSLGRSPAVVLALAMALACVLALAIGSSVGALRTGAAPTPLASATPGPLPTVS